VPRFEKATYQWYGEIINDSGIDQEVEQRKNNSADLGSVMLSPTRRPSFGSIKQVAETHATLLPRIFATIS
jgi:hypothetical protein